MKKSTKIKTKKAIVKGYEIVGKLLAIGGFIVMAGAVGNYVQIDGQLLESAIIFGGGAISSLIGSVMIGEVMNLENK